MDTDIIEQLAELRPAAREWGESVLAEFDLDATGRVLVLQAAYALDTIERARDGRTAVVEDGRYEGSAREAASLSVEQRARNAFLATLKVLNLGDD